MYEFVFSNVLRFLFSFSLLLLNEVNFLHNAHLVNFSRFRHPSLKDKFRDIDMSKELYELRNDAKVDIEANYLDIRACKACIFPFLSLQQVYYSFHSAVFL